MPEPKHIPVLLNEALEILAPQSGGRYIDATLGGGGHAEAILQVSSPQGRLLGLDADPRAIERVRTRLAPFGDRAILVNANFREIGQIARAHNFTEVDGILFDLGVSSYHVDTPDQGFSFMQEGPLDMRLDPTRGLSAADVVNTFDEQELADILYRYGEERRSWRIARKIIANRPISSTTQLANIVIQAIGRNPKAKRHPATRTFQALRIYVNDELGALEAALPQALDLLKPGGVLVVISFHSLEDRIVKHFLRQESRDCICPPHTPICVCGHKAQIELIHRKGVTPSPDEINQNPRSRSARLRAARKVTR